MYPAHLQEILRIRFRALKEAAEKEKSELAHINNLPEAERERALDARQERLDSRYKRKQLGKCPFCGETVQALVVESNKVRRDRCMCPKRQCRQSIYVCRSPGCHDYAKGTESYDHEFCPDCTSVFADGAKAVGTAVLTVGAAVAKEMVMQEIKGNKGKGKSKGKK